MSNFFICTLQLGYYCNLVATSTFFYMILFFFFPPLTPELLEHNVFSLACVRLTWKHSFHFDTLCPHKSTDCTQNEKQRESRLYVATF